MKVSWPLSSREALIHYYTFEYFQDGLVVVLLNTISELESISTSTHGFTRDGIPDAEDVVRIDVVGGFALQKVTSDRSYFRTIANMDIKLDFVPPAFINFISRQLVGSGFKLYKKEVASVSSKGDEFFGEVLKDPLYTRIHEALYSQDTPLRNTQIRLDEQNTKALGDNNQKETNVHDDGVIMDRDRKACNEIEEDQSLDKTSQTSSGSADHLKNKVVIISTEVGQALGTLEKAIAVFRQCNNSDDDESEHKLGGPSLMETKEIAADEGSSSYVDLHLSEIKKCISPTSFTENQTVFESITVMQNYSLLSPEANSTTDRSKNRKSIFCCLNLNSDS